MELENQIYNKLLEDFKKIERNLAYKIVNDNFSILLGEQELIDDFSDYLKENGIDICHDIDRVLIGQNVEQSEPVKILKTNKKTNEIKFLDICLIKKTDKFMNIISNGLIKSNEIIKEDLNKLIYVELDLSGGKKSIYSNYLAKEMTEDNVFEALDKIFNIERTLKSQITDLLRMLKTEQENNDIMYA